MAIGSKYAGSGWIASHKWGEGMSALGVSAADLLGDVFLGIYHIESKELVKVNWGDTNMISVPINESLCTVDFDHLTRLMVLAHDRMIRVDIGGFKRGWLLLKFHQRTTREGHMFERYPTLEDHAAVLRQHYGEPRK